MAPTTVKPLDTEEKPTVHDRITDAYRHAAHISHEAQLLKSVAQDAVEDGVHAAKRAIKSIGRRAEALGDLKDEAVYRVKRRPFQAIGAAFGVGLVLGLAVAWMLGRSSVTPAASRES